MGNEYEPELGQLVFGQPWQEYDAPELLISVLRSIDTMLETVLWNIHQEQYVSPFSNTGANFKCNNTFEVQAYSWNEDINQEWNFKWKDLRVSWYKHLKRGTTVNRLIEPDEIAELLKDCYGALIKYEKEHDKDLEDN